MSWWCHSRSRAAQARCVAAFLAACCASARAADVSVQPLASLSTASNSNIELTTVPSERQSVEMASADIATVIDVATPDWQTIIKPRVSYDYYPSAAGFNQLEEYLDFSSQWSAPRDRIGVMGGFNRINDLDAEVELAEYNPVNPNAPTNTSSGQIVQNQVRNYEWAQPTYSHNLTPLLSLNLSGTAERMTFSPEDTVSHVDFDYFEQRTSLGWSIDPRDGMSFGAFEGYYGALHLPTHAFSDGGFVDFGRSWSPVWQSSVELLYEHIRNDQTLGGQTAINTGNVVGAALSTTYKGQTDQLRASISRRLDPSSVGGLYRTDEARVEYDRSFTQRLDASVAARYLRSNSIATLMPGPTRNYAVTQLFVRWMMTPVIYLQAGFMYAYQRYTTDPTFADTQSFSLQIGYRGLPPQR